MKFYYYGLAYSLGFVGLHLWMRWRRERIGWDLEEVYDFSIVFAVCLLVFGRAFEIVFYELEYYREHWSQVLSFWRGGMASHGVLLGGIVAVFLFGRLSKKRFLVIADLVVIPGAFLLALGRIGNFINGQICGTVTDVWWAVEFADVEGLRHPVTLYESLKNFMLIPILLAVRRKSRYGEGKLLAHFIFWYGFLRIFTDVFRQYGAEYFGIGRGQYFNGLMALAGIGLYVWLMRRGRPVREECVEVRMREHSGAGKVARRVVFAFLVVLALLIPSGWTKGVLKELLERETSVRVRVTPTSGTFWFPVEDANGVWAWGSSWDDSLVRGRFPVFRHRLNDAPIPLPVHVVDHSRPHCSNRICPGKLSPILLRGYPG